MNEDDAGDLWDWAVGEQEDLWNDLDWALRNAINGSWSINSANLAVRIRGAARVVGPTPYTSVPWRLLAGGVYDAILTGISHDLPDDTQWRELEDLMRDHGDRTKHEHDMARTVLAIARNPDIAA